MTTYKLYIVKKFYTPIEVQADSVSDAEEKAYALMEMDNADGKHDSDDTYIHFEGEAESCGA
jgi:hypothetical protein